MPATARVIDANGMSVLPGLWEAHGHLFHVGEADPGAFQLKFADQLVPIMEAVARVTVESGVTAMRDFCTSCASQAVGLEQRSAREIRRSCGSEFWRARFPGRGCISPARRWRIRHRQGRQPLRRRNRAGSERCDAQARRRGRRQHLHRRARVAGAAARCDRRTARGKRSGSGRRGAPHHCTQRAVSRPAWTAFMSSLRPMHWPDTRTMSCDSWFAASSRRIADRPPTSCEARGYSARCRCGRRT